MFKQSVNGKIAVEVPQNREAKVEVQNGWVNYHHHKRLLGLKVLAKSEKYNAGDTVWVSGDFASRVAVFEHNGQQFCWVSESEVMAYDRQDSDFKSNNDFVTSTTYTPSAQATK